MMRWRLGSTRSSMIESECSSALRPAWPFVAWSVPSSRMFVGESRMSPFWCVSADVVPAGRRLWAAATPLRTERKPANDQISRRTSSAGTATSSTRFQIRRRRAGRGYGPPSPRAGSALPSRPVSGTLPFVRPPR